MTWMFFKDKKQKGCVTNAFYYNKYVYHERKKHNSIAKEQNCMLPVNMIMHFRYLNTQIIYFSMGNITCELNYGRK